MYLWNYSNVKKVDFNFMYTFLINVYESDNKIYTYGNRVNF